MIFFLVFRNNDGNERRLATKLPDGMIVHVNNALKSETRLARQTPHDCPRALSQRYARNRHLHPLSLSLSSWSTDNQATQPINHPSPSPTLPPHTTIITRSVALLVIAVVSTGVVM